MDCCSVLTNDLIPPNRSDLKTTVTLAMHYKNTEKNCEVIYIDQAPLPKLQNLASNPRESAVIEGEEGASPASRLGLLGMSMNQAATLL